MKKYNCYHCGNVFEARLDLTTDRPICNDCFRRLTSIHSYPEYLDFSQKRFGAGISAKSTDK